MKEKKRPFHQFHDGMQWFCNVMFFEQFRSGTIPSDFISLVLIPIPSIVRWQFFLFLSRQYLFFSVSFSSHFVVISFSFYTNKWHFYLFGISFELSFDGIEWNNKECHVVGKNVCSQWNIFDVFDLKNKRTKNQLEEKTEDSNGKKHCGEE